MPGIWTMGELLVEIMRTQEDVELYTTGEFRGPFPSGAPGIFISTAARLGHRAGIISGVGDDDFGRNILDRLKKDGVNCDYVLESRTGVTGAAFVTYFSSGERKFIFHINHTPAVEAKSPKALSEEMKSADFFHIMGCSLMPSVEFGKEILKTMYKFKDNGSKISFDPNVRLEMLKDPTVYEVIKEVYENSNIFMPGISELKMITKQDDVDKAIQKAFENESMQVLVLKNGSKGSRIYTRNGLAAEQSIYPVEEADPTGAGDSYDAAFLCGLAEGKNLADAAKMGAAAGALNAAAFGPMEGQINPDTVKKMIGDNE